MIEAIRWMARNHVAANLLMMVFVVGGLIMGFSAKQEIFPEVSLDLVRISVSYPGAGPEEVEEGVLLKIEENLTGIDGIKEVKSLAGEGYGSVTAEIREGEDVDVVLQDIKSEVDRITTFPRDAEEPVITKVLNRREVISVVVYGDLSERTLREHAERIRDELLEMPQITQVDLSGVRPYEISVEISEDTLRQYNLTLDGVARRIGRASLDIPGGSMKTGAGEVLIRTKERRYYGSEYEDISIINDPGGTDVKLGDLASIRDSFEETDEFARFDNMPAAMIRVYRVGDQKPTEISRLVIDYVESKRGELPPSVKLATWNDTSELFESRMNLLLKNGFYGLVLVFLTLSLFLQVRLALWVMLGIPISFLGAIFLMPAVDVSISMLSLFAFIMALGIVVDDAIVVGENIFEHRQKGKKYHQAAIDGAIGVAGPVVFAVLTSVAAFMPLLFVSGLIGKFIKVIPYVVISVLLVSLVESLFVLPAHLSLGKPITERRGISAAIEKIRNRFGLVLDGFINGSYTKFLQLCLQNRYATLAAAMAILLITAGLVGGGVLKFNFMPQVDGDVILVSLRMPRGTPVEKTSSIQDFIVRRGQYIVAEYDSGRPAGDSILRNIYALVGSSFQEGGPIGGEGGTGSHMANIAMFLAPSEKRGISAEEISRKWRKSVGDVPGAESLTFSANLVHLGDDIDIRLAHENFAVLEKVAVKIKAALSRYPGVEDISDNLARGKREIKLSLRPAAETLGVTEEDLGRQLRSAFFGAEALRLQRGRNEVKVMVRYPESERRSVDDLEKLRIRTSQGGEIPLGVAARALEGKGFSEINRTDRKRVINITASVDSKTANSKDILEEMSRTVLADLTADYPGLTFDLVGEEEERRESMDSMRTGFMLALFGIYALLAIPFRSYSQPLLIMSAIPFGIVGAILGHFILGFDLSILSLFGIVALSGVVVNDSLLLIDYINTLRKRGKDMMTAIVQGGRRRFRPILLTSLTTFFGLTPMMFETSVQAQFLIPMAISLAFGVLFATGITLLLIPALYTILEDVRGLFGLSPFHGNHHVPAEPSQQKSP